MNSEQIQVSVVIPTYNTAWDKLKWTLNSVMLQKGVSFEVVITDDGSKVQHFDCIKAYFAEHAFDKYRIVTHETNVGTVNNIYDGVQASTGMYIRSIGQGDMLYGEDALLRMFTFAQKHNAAGVMSDAVYFDVDGNRVRVHVRDAMPQNTKCFDDYVKLRKNYILYADVGLGATMLYSREKYLQYLKLICGRIIYAEDHIVPLMILKRDLVLYYDEVTTFYEYGTGISTQHSAETERKLRADKQAYTDIAQEICSDKAFVRCMNRCFTAMHAYLQAPSMKKKLDWTVKTPGFIKFRILRKLKRRRTLSDVPMAFVNQCVFE